jgi:hypothetical protein
MPPDTREELGQVMTIEFVPEATLLATHTDIWALSPDPLRPHIVQILAGLEVTEVQGLNEEAANSRMVLPAVAGTLKLQVTGEAPVQL